MTDNKQSPSKLSRRALLRSSLATAVAAACQPMATSGGTSDVAGGAAGSEEIEMLAFW